jgi:hypothetical protein
MLFGTQIKKDIWFYTEELRATIKQNLERKINLVKELNIAVALLMGQKQDISSEDDRLSICRSHSYFIGLWIARLLFVAFF